VSGQAISGSADATARLGAAIAAILVPGDVVSLAGPLGAGKTRFVQGVGAGLGVRGRITSPTFVLVRHHAGRVPLVHVDAYRLEHVGDLLALDDDVLAPDVVTCIEWGDAVEGALPAERLDVTLAVAGEHEDAPRLVTLVAHGRAWDARRELLRATAAAALAALTPLTPPAASAPQVLPGPPGEAST
jgi:tRNA threonylcarbamoyladenosine biosynthesis protein TsaE